MQFLLFADPYGLQMVCLLGRLQRLFYSFVGHHEHSLEHSTYRLEG